MTAGRLNRTDPARATRIDRLLTGGWDTPCVPVRGRRVHHRAPPCAAWRQIPLRAPGSGGRLRAPAAPDSPTETRLSFDITPLTDPRPAPASRRLAWLASGADGVPLGSAFLRLFTKEGQEHLAELRLAVHGTERRRGVGTRLLEAAVDAARTERRRSVIAEAEQDSPADLFLAARGFRQVLALTYTRLPLADVD